MFSCLGPRWPSPQAAHFRNELRAQVGALNDELSRAHADRAAAQGAIERLSRQLADSQAAMAMEARRQMEEQVRGEGGRKRATDERDWVRVVESMAEGCHGRGGAAADGGACGEGERGRNRLLGIGDDVQGTVGYGGLRPAMAMEVGGTHAPSHRPRTASSAPGSGRLRLLPMDDGLLPSSNAVLGPCCYFLLTAASSHLFLERAPSQAAYFRQELRAQGLVLGDCCYFLFATAC